MAGTRPRAVFDMSRMKCAASRIVSRIVPASANNAAFFRVMWSMNVCMGPLRGSSSLRSRLRHWLGLLPTSPALSSPSFPGSVSDPLPRRRALALRLTLLQCRPTLPLGGSDAPASSGAHSVSRRSCLRGSAKTRPQLRLNLRNRCVDLCLRCFISNSAIASRLLSVFVCFAMCHSRQLVLIAPRLYHWRWSAAG